jgi:glucose/arabinose dehydrogenase
MRVLPRTRRGWAVVAALLVIVAGLAWKNRYELTWAVKMAVPGPVYSAADDRTSDPAPAGPDVPLPEALEAPRATGANPAIRLGSLIELPGASALADPPGPGPVLVTTLDGRVHEVDLGAGTNEVVLDISERISTGGERGLLGIAGPVDGRLYLDYTDSGGDTEVRSWAVDDTGRPEAGEGVLHLEIGQPFDNHNGGNLVVGPDGTLWIGTGDGGGSGDRGEVAQDDTSLLGKMLRVVPDTEGGVVAPTTNPDWDRPEIWGIGLRNPWRYSFDRATNRLWIADVGQDEVEEVNVVDAVEPRPNFGWDTVEGGNDYEGVPSPDFAMPVVTYGHDQGCSITGGYVYRGEVIDSLYGWYLFSDYCTGFVDAVPADRPASEPVRLLEDAGNVVSFGELEDGELVVLATDGIRRVLAG